MIILNSRYSRKCRVCNQKTYSFKVFDRDNICKDCMDKASQTAIRLAKINKEKVFDLCNLCGIEATPNCHKEHKKWIEAVFKEDLELLKR